MRRVPLRVAVLGSTDAGFPINFETMTEDSTNATPTTERTDADAQAEATNTLAAGKRDSLSDSGADRACPASPWAS